MTSKGTTKWLRRYTCFDMIYLVVASAVPSVSVQLQTISEAPVAVHDECHMPRHRPRLQQCRCAAAQPAGHALTPFLHHASRRAQSTW